MTITTTGRKFTIYNVAVTDSADAAVTITSTGVRKVTSLFIQCRTAAAIQLKKASGDSEYFTIRSGTTFELPIAAIQDNVFFLRSTSGSITAEILAVEG